MKKHNKKKPKVEKKPKLRKRKKRPFYFFCFYNMFIVPDATNKI